VAEAFRRLDAGVSALGGRATVSLIGRSDPTGPDSTNQALSELRAQAVAAALASRGVALAAVRIRAAGTAIPLAASDSAERARINRSVSFTIGVR
jgi:outer membrane protein OmpA-like peptidoglycan-associated protein